jgi:hypothetical protein
MAPKTQTCEEKPITEQWNEILDDLSEFERLAAADTTFRIFFHGVEVHHFDAERSHKGLLPGYGLGIFVVDDVDGQNCRINHYRYKRIAYFHPFQDIDDIRKELQALEIRRVAIVDRFPRKGKNDGI